MKQLYLNNKRVVLNPDTYFPFTQKVSVLDDFTIIGMPASKTVTLPRCQENDEIFGYIAEITRIVSASSDNLIGVSFNQIRKVSYKLYSNSDIISEGIIRIVNITNDGYEIELYDKVIDLIETFDSEEGLMSNLDLVLSTGVYNNSNRASVVKQLNDAEGELKVLANIKSDTGETEAVVTTGGVLNKVTLPAPLTPLQFRTLKNYDFEYAVPLTTVVRSINNSFPNSIELDSEATDLFNEVHMLLGSSKKERVIQNYTANGGTLASSSGNVNTVLTNPINSFDFKQGTAFLGRNNGIYDLYIPFELTFTPSSNVVFIGSKKDEPGTFFYPGAPYGTHYGDLTIGVWFSGYSGSTELYGSRYSKLSIRALEGVNTVVTTSGIYIQTITISGVFPANIETYPQIIPTIADTKINFDFSELFSSTSAFMIFKAGTTVVNFTLDKVLSDFTVDYRSSDNVRTGDPLILFSKISIKEFLINTTKYFNLGIKNNNGVIQLHTKNYTKASQPVLLDEVSSLEPNNFDFSKLLIKNTLPTSNILTDYQTNTKKYYGEQVINTDYRIKKNTKEITFEIGVPVLVKDYNAFGYDRFAQYYNSGYSRTTNGLTSGLDGKISFCYVKRNDEALWVSDDSYFEAGIGLNSDEIKFGLYNEKVTYTGGEFTYPTIDDGTGSRLLEFHYTASPYLFGSDGVINKSLDINKPEYNFAGIADINYPNTTTIYSRYFKNLVQDIYNVNTHILNVKMWIDDVLDIYKIYNYKNSNYVISELVEYDPTKNGIYEVKLLRVNNINNYIVPTYLIDCLIYQDLIVEGDITAYEGEFLGISSDVLFSEGDVENYVVKHSFVPSLTSTTLIGGNTWVTNEITYVDTVRGALERKYKVVNNKFLHSITPEGETILLGDSNSVTINNSASVDIMDLDLTSRIKLEDNGDRLVQLGIYDAYIESVNSLQPDEGQLIWDWIVTVKLTAKVVNGESLTSNSKFDFMGLFLTARNPSDPSETDVFNLDFDDNTSAVYSNGLDSSRVLTLTFKLEGLTYSSTTVANSFTTNRIKSISETGGYAFRVSYGGDFTDSIVAVDNQQIPLTGNPSSQYNYLAFTGDYNDTSVYADLLNYKINFNYTNTLQ